MHSFLGLIPPRRLNSYDYPLLLSNAYPVIVSDSMFARLFSRQKTLIRATYSFLQISIQSFDTEILQLSRLSSFRKYVDPITTLTGSAYTKIPLATLQFQTSKFLNCLLIRNITSKEMMSGSVQAKRSRIRCLLYIRPSLNFGPV